MQAAGGGVLGTHDLLHFADRFFGYLHHVVYLLLDCREVPSLIIRWDRTTPTFNHLDGALWDSVAEKSTLNSGGGAKSGDRQDCQRISGKRRRKSMAVLSVPEIGRAPYGPTESTTWAPPRRGRRSVARC